MADDSVLTFAFPAIHGRKIAAAFDGGRLTSDGVENLIKLHKSRLKSDHMSCRSANANQMRIILQTAVLAHMGRPHHAGTNPLRNAEFSTIRLWLLKLVTRVVETASRLVDSGIDAVVEKAGSRRGGSTSSDTMTPSLSRVWEGD